MLNLKNQFISAPIKLGYSDESGEIKEKHLSFYRERSEYLGAVTPEPMYLDKGLREIPTQIGIDSDDKIAGLQKLTGVIHTAGAKAIAHLNHPGRMANPKLPGNTYLSSTDKPCESGGAIPKAMERKDMDAVIRLFTGAAKRAREAGFDIIELQMGHGYLLAQFISPAVNDREDEYGGSFENRVRFSLSVLDAVQNAVELPVIVRISGDEMIPNGIKLDEMIALSKILEQRGVAAVHVSAGTVCSTPPWFFQHMFTPKGKTWDLAAQIKKEVQIPVIFVGRVNSAKDIDRLKSEYQADYIALGRALVADPDFIAKYLRVRKGTIRPCLACSEGCLGGVKSGQGLHCVVNPLVGGGEEQPAKTVQAKKYAVVGGGLAGMEAALTLNERGHAVNLYEKYKLGGQFNLAWLPPQKESLKEIIDYFEYELKRSSVNIIPREAQPEELLSAGYDGVLLATGAVPEIPKIAGLSEYYWAEFLGDENLPENKKVVIIGGGLIGVEIASKLVEKGNEVIIVEMLDEMARGMEMIEKKMTLAKLKLKNVPMYTNCRVTKIDGDKVTLSGEKNLILQNVDKIVIATGMKSYNPLAEKLKGKIPVWSIGDAEKVGKAQEAIRSGYETAKNL